MIEAAKDRAVEAIAGLIAEDPGSVARLAEALNQLRKDGRLDPAAIEGSARLEALAAEIEDQGKEGQMFASLIRNRGFIGCVVGKLCD